MKITIHKGTDPVLRGEADWIEVNYDEIAIGFTDVEKFTYLSLRSIEKIVIESCRVVIS